MTYKWFKDLCLALERTFHSLPPRFMKTTMTTPGASSPVTFYFPPLLSPDGCNVVQNCSWYLNGGSYWSAHFLGCHWPRSFNEEKFANLPPGSWRYARQLPPKTTGRLCILLLKITTTYHSRRTTIFGTFVFHVTKNFFSYPKAKKFTLYRMYL